MTTTTNTGAASLSDEQKRAAITACALMIKGICLTTPNAEWTERIENRIHYLLRQIATTPQADAAPTVAEQFVPDAAMNFAAYLIDHCEGETVTEESLQVWLGKMVKLPRYNPSAESTLASMTRMFHAACADLGAINEALGLDPDDGGAEPILEAIAELRAAIAAGGAQEAVGEILREGNDSAFKVSWLRPPGPNGTKLYAEPLPRVAATVLTDGWISVDERLPENDQVVAFVVMTDQQSPNWHLNGRVLGGTYHENWGFSTPGVGHRASHWMPLPAAPAASNGEQA